MTGPLGRDELLALGVAEVGEHVAVDSTVRIYGAARLRIGSNVRIDAYTVLSAGEGGIASGDHVHIGAHAFLVGAGAITVRDFAGLSGRVSVYSSTDDFSGEALTGPTVPDSLRNVSSAPVEIGRHVIVGAASVILPGVTLAEGSGVGAMSLVRRAVAPFTLVAGVPARPVGERSRRLLELEQRL